MKTCASKLAAILLGGALCAPCGAQIYRYEDAEGWHFTDTPPADRDCEGVEGVGPPSKASLPGDLVAHLSEAAKPHTVLERAAMAVVKVEGKFAFGSGFFVSGDGHLLTNRHVVRPTEPWQVEATLERIHELERAFEAQKRALANWRDNLERARARLEEGKRHLEANPNDHPSVVALRDYEAHHVEALSRYQAARRKYVLLKREFDNARWDFTMRSTSALSARRFTVTLADGSALTAGLVAISKEWDLALLRVEGHETPALAPSSRPLHQGDSVVAIGSSLAVSNALTAGIVSDLDDDSILTDARVLAGNSGGPIVDQEGKVLGVISARLTGDDSAGAFGVAIPVARAEPFWTSAIEGEKAAAR